MHIRIFKSVVKIIHASLKVYIINKAIENNTVLISVIVGVNECMIEFQMKQLPLIVTSKTFIIPSFSSFSIQCGKANTNSILNFI